jgi:hypothetical protein
MKWDEGAWTGLIWLRIGKGGGTCECGNEPSEFHKMQGIPRLGENWLASQEELCSME